MKKNKKANPRRGSSLRALLQEDGILDETEANALKRAVAHQLRKAIKDADLSKSEMASRMRTSRAAVDRLLSSSNPSATLNTIEKAARAVGLRVRIDLVHAD